MLSILIPVYNFDLTDLVQDLHREAEQLTEAIEIILADDGSKEDWKIKNRPLAKLPLVSYEELPQNLGRSGIRNYLSSKAKYDYLLFLDNDQGIPQKPDSVRRTCQCLKNNEKGGKSLKVPDELGADRFCERCQIGATFLKRYLKNLHPEKVTVGGRCYGKSQPGKVFLLHWEVGRNREVIPANIRNENPHDSFLSCNFVVPKSVFEKIKFDESLTQYGHEDTLFGLELERRGIDILHIENPLEHLGLESAEVFLEKSKKAIENLVFLYKKTGFSKTKLIRIYLKINKLGLVRPVLFCLKILKPFLLNNLKSKHPKLLFFDLFKLLVFLEKAK